MALSVLYVDQIDLAGMWGVVSCCASLYKRVCGPAAPGDVGGSLGPYTEFLEAITNPTHEWHSESSEWAGQPFDPCSVNAEQLAQAVKKTRQQWTPKPAVNRRKTN
jgi:hypothetical protein